MYHGVYLPYVPTYNLAGILSVSAGAGKTYSLDLFIQ